MTWDIGELNRNKHLRPSTKKKISEKMKGHSPWNKEGSLTEEHKRKISETFKKKKIQPNYFFPLGHKPWNKGKPRTPEEKEKMRIAAIQVWKKRKKLKND